MPKLLALALPLFALVIGSTAHAQDITIVGGIEATVRTIDGPSIPGVKVTLLAQDGRTEVKTATTPKTGAVRFYDLANGDYYVRSEMRGFFTNTIGPIRIRHGANAPGLRPLDIRLNPGPVYPPRNAGNRTGV